MKKRLFLLLSVLVLPWVHAQKTEKIKGNREVVTKIYPLPPFKAVEVGDDLHVTLKPAADTTALELRADSNLHDVLQWNVTDSVLHLSLTKEILKKKAFDITLFAGKELSRIKIYESARLETDGKLSFPRMRLETAGYAKAEAAFLIRDTLEILMKEKSKLVLDADAKNMTATLQNGAHLKASLTGKYLELTASGSSKAQLGGSMKHVLWKLKEKAECNGANLGVKNRAEVHLDDKTEAELKGRGAVIVMFLTGKSQLELSGNFKKYELEKFRDHSVLSRKP